MLAELRSDRAGWVALGENLFASNLACGHDNSVLGSCSPWLGRNVGVPSLLYSYWTSNDDIFGIVPSLEVSSLETHLVLW